MFMQIGLKHTGDPEISITTMFFTRMRNLCKRTHKLKSKWYIVCFRVRGKAKERVRVNLLPHPVKKMTRRQRSIGNH
jgi:hypothetical protein